MSGYPAMLQIQGKPAVVVGGGKVAARKVLSLVEAGAAVTVISPNVTPKLSVLAEDGNIQWKEKLFQEGDTADALIVVAATSNKEVNREIAALSHPFQLVNVVSEPRCGNFTVPAVWREGPLTVSVSTNGGSPLLAKKIRDDIKEKLENVYEEALRSSAEQRDEILSTVDDPAERERLLRASVENPDGTEGR